MLLLKITCALVIIFTQLLLLKFCSMFSNILIQIYVFLSDWKNDPWYESHVELKVIVKISLYFSQKKLDYCKLVSNPGGRGEHWKDREHASASMGTKLWPWNWQWETGLSILQQWRRKTKRNFLKKKIFWSYETFCPQITFNIYQYNTKMKTPRLAGSCQLYGVYITDALKYGKTLLQFDTDA